MDEHLVSGTPYRTLAELSIASPRLLRDCLYNVYLSRAHGLAAIEQMLEIPLDSITARAIRGEIPELPRWPGVRNLRPDLSAAYQAAALAVAKREGIARVHLDAYWWGGARE